MNSYYETNKKSISDKRKVKYETMKQDPILYEIYLEKQRVKQLKRLSKIKADPNKYMQYAKQHNAAKIARGGHKGKLSHRFAELNGNAKKVGVRQLISKDDLKNIITNKYCYISGLKISEHMPQTGYAYYLDRLGKKEHGGNGIAGGDYHLDNVKPCIFKFNELRAVLNVDADTMALIFAPFRAFIKAKQTKQSIGSKFKTFLSSLTIKNPFKKKGANV